MKIWIDLRFLQKDNFYSLFVFEVVKQLIKTNKHNIILYTNTKFDEELGDCKIEIVTEIIWSIWENFSLINKFKKEKFDLMIFFNEYKPLSYKEDYILLIPSLQRLFFGPYKNSITKYYYLRLLSSNLKNAKKIICFDKQTLSDLNERFNIEEEKIEMLKWFFLINNNDESNNNSSFIDIKNKYSIKWDYIIYDSLESSIKNLDKVLLAIKKMKDEKTMLNLIILWNDAWKNLEFRKMVLDYEISDLVFFVWEIEENEKINYYKQCVWLIYPNIYDTFPFELNKALIYKTPIIVSDLESIREATLNELDYFNALSNMDTLEALKSFLKKKKNPNYTKILNSNSREKYVEKFNEIIEKL